MLGQRRPPVSSRNKPASPAVLPSEPRTLPVKQRFPFNFRSRLLVILALFAFVPSILLTLVWSGMAARVLPVLTGTAAWEHVAESGEEAIRLSRTAPGSEAALEAIARHEAELGESRLQARRFRYSRFITTRSASSAVCNVGWVSAFCVTHQALRSNTTLF